VGVDGGDIKMAMEMGLRFGVADGGSGRMASTAAVRPEREEKEEKVDLVTEKRKRRRLCGCE